MLFFSARVLFKDRRSLVVFSRAFPETKNECPVRYMNLRGHNAIKDETVVLWINLDNAALIVSIVKTGVLKDGFNPDDVVHITHYTAQRKIFRHAYAELIFSPCHH